MNETAMFLPMVAMFLITFLVWISLFARRLPYMLIHKIPAQAMATPDAVPKLLPESVNNPSNNLKNLFELPVIFYALCFTIHLVGATDSTFVKLAWYFVIGRFLHSAIHCTFNNVNLRFFAYFMSSLALWAMLIRLVRHLDWSPFGVL